MQYDVENNIVKFLFGCFVFFFFCIFFVCVVSLLGLRTVESSGEDVGKKREIVGANGF